MGVEPEHMTRHKTDGNGVDLWYRTTACFGAQLMVGGSRTCTIQCPLRSTRSGRALLDLRPM